MHHIYLFIFFSDPLSMNIKFKDSCAGQTLTRCSYCECFFNYIVCVMFFILQFFCHYVVLCALYDFVQNVCDKYSPGVFAPMILIGRRRGPPTVAKYKFLSGHTRLQVFYFYFLLLHVKSKVFYQMSHFENIFFIIAIFDLC